MNTLSRRLADKYHMSVNDAKFMIKTVLTVVEDTIVEDGLMLQNFGTFNIVHQNTRLVRNPKTKEELMMQPRDTIRFSPGKRMKEKLNNKT